MLMRSKLFVPGSKPEIFIKAAASAADALSFDLEDAVALSQKDNARTALAMFLQSDAARCGKGMIIRVNALNTPFFEADMQEMVLPVVDAINLPMVEEPETVHAAANLLARLESKAGISKPIGLLLNIETPRGLRRAAELACSHPRVVGLQIGYADLMEPTGIDRRDESALAHIRLATRMAAAEAGVPAYDGAFGNVRDLEGYRREAEAAKRHGFSGKSCIHPTQIAVANAVFMPSEAEINHARAILTAARDAEARGIGVFMVGDQMIDAPFLERARNIARLAGDAGMDVQDLEYLKNAKT